MVKQTARMLRGGAALHEHSAAYNEADADAEPEVADDGAGHAGARPPGGRLIWPIVLAWVVLIAGVALIENGGNLFTLGFWASSRGLALITEAALPALLVFGLRALGDQLGALRAQSEQVRAAIVQFSEPEPVSSGNIVSIRHAVHRELNSLNEHLDRSLNRTSEIEAIIKREVETLGNSFADNERRMLGLVQELARQRETVVSATEHVRDVVKTNREVLNSELANLASQVLEAGNYARGVVEEVNVELKGELSARGSEFAEALRHMVADKIEPINDMLGAQVRAMDTLLSDGNGGIVSIFQDHGQALVANLDSAWERISTDLANRSRLAEDTAARLTGLIDQSLESSVNRLENRIKTTSLEILGVLDGAAEQASQRLAEVSADSTTAFDRHVETLREQVEQQGRRLGELVDGAALRFIPALERHSGTLERAIGLEQAFEQSTSRLSDVLSVQATAFVDTLSQHLHDFQMQLGEQSNLISDGLTGKLDKAAETLEDGSRRFGTTLQNVQDTISVATDKLTIAAAAYNAEFAQRVDQIENLVAEGAERIDEHLSRGTAELALTLADGSHTVEQALGSWTSRLGEVMADGFNQSDAMVQARIGEMQALETGHRQALEAALSGAVGSIETLIADGGGVLEAAGASARLRLGEITGQFGVELRTLWEQFATDLGGFATRAETSLAENGEANLGRLDLKAAEILDGLQGRLGGIYGSLDARTRELEANITQFGASIDTQTSRLNKVIGQKSEAIEHNLEDGIGRFDQAMGQHLVQTQVAVAQFVREESETFKRQMELLTRALDGQSEALGTRVEAVSSLLDTRSREFETRIAQFGSGIEAQAGRLREVVSQKAQLLEQNVGDGVGMIENLLSTHLKRTQSVVQHFADDESAAFERQVDVLSRTLDSRSEILDSILRTRGEDFTDKLYSSSRQFEEKLAETSRALETTVRSGGTSLGDQLAGQTAELERVFAEALDRLDQAASERAAETGTRLSHASSSMNEALERKSAALLEALEAETGTLERVLRDGGGRIGSALREESQRLTAMLSETAGSLERSIGSAAHGVGAELRGQVATVTAALDDGRNRLGQAVEQAALDLDRVAQQGSTQVKASLDRSLEAATRLLNAGVETTQQQISVNVETLLSRLASHEKTATSRMESAAATVGENTRKAAELTAERLVTLNGALVQVLSSLGSTRTPPRKAKVEVLPNAAE